jgi:ABC-type tungstate transport system permease subunit
VVAPTSYSYSMRETQRKGDIAVAQAIATFTREGYDVSIPLTESAAYDLIVERYGIIKRVQVRYSTDGEVDLRRIHSNSTGYVVKKAKKGAYDWLYVFKASSEEEYLVIDVPFGRRSIKPNPQHFVASVLKKSGGVA